MTKGIRIYNESGGVRLSSDGTFLRYFGGHTLAANFSGTFTMTGFDETSGFFVPAFRLRKTDNTGAKFADSQYWTYSPNYTPGGVMSGANLYEIPDLVFSSGTMTVTDRSIPAAFDGDMAFDQEVFLGFYYYKGGKSVVSGSKSIEIRNEDGDLQISFERTMYAKRTGTTSLVESSGTLSTRSLITAQFGNQYAGLTGLVPVQRPTNFSLSFDKLAQTPNGSWTSEAVGSTSILTPQFYDDKSDLVFFRLTQPICYQAHYYHEYPDLAETGSFTVVATSNNSAVDYAVCSTTPPAGAPSSTKGLQLRLDDGSNTVTYDSRYPTLKILHTFLISEADMFDIVENNTVKDYTIPSIADPWICCPYWMSFRSNGFSTSNANILRPQIAKLNNTTLRVSRVGTWSSDLVKRGQQGAWVIVAEGSV